MAIVGSFVRRISPAIVITKPRHRARKCSLEVQSSSRSVHGCRLIGVGSSLPETVLTNLDLEKLVETSDAWISRRTGIRERRVLKEHEKLSEHAIDATKRALEMSEMNPVDVDCVLFATSSPDDIFGSASQVQHAIGATNAVAFDLTAACSGFVLATITAAQYIRSGCFSNIVVIGGDALSRFVDWRDRSTCILFGDGCGALVLTQQQSPSCSLLGTAMRTDGSGYQHLKASFTNSTPSKPQATDDRIASSQSRFDNVFMNGQEVFRWAVKGIPKIIEDALEDGSMTSDSLDWLVMHQANQRILDAAAQRLNLPPDRVVSNLAKYGNTSAASIPIALDEAVRNGDIQSGDVIAMAGFGAGLTMAAAIVRWN